MKRASVTPLNKYTQHTSLWRKKKNYFVIIMQYTPYAYAKTKTQEAETAQLISTFIFAT